MTRRTIRPLGGFSAARRRRPALVIACLAAAWPVASAAQSPAVTDDPFARSIVGRWAGEGVVYGSPVTLEREWAFELGDRFLRADMRVGMANGASFRVVQYWRLVGAQEYDIVALDELGQRRLYRGAEDGAGDRIVTHHLDVGTDEMPGWRRIEYEILSDDRYRERMHVETATGWEEVAEFVFHRIPR